MAYQASPGPASDFIRQYQDANQQAAWAQMKAELAVRFSEVSDTQHAFMLLRKEKQKHSETMQVYVEMLLTLAEDAFVGPTGGTNSKTVN